MERTFKVKVIEILLCDFFTQVKIRLEASKQLRSQALSGGRGSKSILVSHESFREASTTEWNELSNSLQNTLELAMLYSLKQ